MAKLNERRSGELTEAGVAPVSLAFGRISHEELIAEAGRGVRSMTIRKNKDVLVAGKPYGAIYVNHSGWLVRYKILHDGSRQVIDFILPGQIFGLQACVFKKSLYSVATITESSVSEISFEMIDDFFERSPKLAKVLFWSAASEAAIVGEHLIDAARRSAYERLSHLFLELFVRLKEAGLTSDMSFEMPLTQELIGDAIGLTTVHVNRTIRSLREDKLIAFDHKVVTILDFEGLALLSDFENSYLSAAVDAIGKEMNLRKPDEMNQRKRARHL